jgi:hypothetical protein
MAIPIRFALRIESSLVISEGTTKLAIAKAIAAPIRFELRTVAVSRTRVRLWSSSSVRTGSAIARL